MTSIRSDVSIRMLMLAEFQKISPMKRYTKMLRYSELGLNSFSFLVDSR